jgi:predicted DNA-binding WGR domain protein
MLMKMVNSTKYLWWIKVEQKSRGQATITTLYGTEGGKMASHSKTITAGAAGRSPHEQALRDALVLWEAKKKEGYTEVRAISRKSRAGNLKSLNNFVPFAK